MGFSIGQLYLELLADGGRLQQSIEKEATGAADKASAKTGQTLGQGIAKNAKRGITAAGTAIGVFVASGIEQFGDFQQRMNEVFTLLPDITNEQMSKMSDDVKAFSRETGKLPDEVIPALYQAISAGVPQDNVFDFLRTANKGAVAGVAKTEDEVGLLAAVTKGFGDTSQAATAQAADLSQLMVKLGQTTIPELAASYGKAVPLASALGVSNQQLAAASASLFGVTGNTAEVMTQMKGVFTALIQQNPNLTAGLKKMGFATSQQAIESLGLKGTLDALVKTTGGSTQALQQMLGSSEAVTAALALTGAQSDTFGSNLEAMANATGTVDAAFARMDTGIAATGRKLAATAATVAIDVGEKFQAIGPVLLALNQGGQLFGVSPAKLIGGAGGAIAGKLAGKLGPALAKALGRSVASGIEKGVVDGAAQAATSGAVGGAGGKLGSLMGSKLGKGLSVAFAAVAILEVVNTYNQISDGLNRQSAKLGTDIGNQITAGTTASLESSKASLEQGVKQLADLWYNPFAGGQKDALQRQLDAVNTELQRRASESPTALAAQLEEGKAKVDGAAADMTSGIPGAVDGAAKDAGAAGKTIPDSIAAGVLEQQNAVTDAMGTLRDLMKNALSPAKRIAHDIGILTSITLAKGLHDKRAVVRAEAKRVRAVAEEDLATLIAAGGKVGKAAGEKLKDGLHSKNAAVRAAAQRVKKIVADKLAETKKPAQAAGVAAGEAYRAGIASALKNVLADILANPTKYNDTLGGKSGGTHAAGGPITAPSWVGEKGPEIFVPEVDGRILTHEDSMAAVLGRGGGGTTVNVYNPRPEPASTSTRRELRKLALSGSAA